jgi:hypothetical protein
MLLVLENLNTFGVPLVSAAAPLSSAATPPVDLNQYAETRSGEFSELTAAVYDCRLTFQLHNSNRAAARLASERKWRRTLCEGEKKVIRGLRHTRLELRSRSTWRNTHAIRKGETTRNPVRNPPRSSCEKTRGGSGQTGI